MALDFGRISLDSGLVLYLFGTPGQSRFRFAWDDVTRGRHRRGDPRRQPAARRRLPVGRLLRGAGHPVRRSRSTASTASSHHELSDVRDALVLDDDIPVLGIDARCRADAKGTLIALVLHALHTRVGAPEPPVEDGRGAARRHPPLEPPRAVRRHRRAGSWPRRSTAACGWSWWTTAPDPRRSPSVRAGLPAGVELVELPAQPRLRPRRQRRLPAHPRPPVARRRRLGRAGARTMPSRPPTAWPACWPRSPSARVPAWPAPTSATAPRRSSTRTSGASSPRRPSTEGWEPAGHPHGTLMLVRARGARARSACSTSATSPTARRPTSRCGPRPPAGRRGSCAAPSSSTPTSAPASPPSTTSSSATRSCSCASTRVATTPRSAGSSPSASSLGGLVSEERRGPYWDPRARVRALVDYARGRFGPPPPSILAR